jgi:hypothetical protein
MNRLKSISEDRIAEILYQIKDIPKSERRIANEFEKEIKKGKRENLSSRIEIWRIVNRFENWGLFSVNKGKQNAKILSINILGIFFLLAKNKIDSSKLISLVEKKKEGLKIQRLSDEELTLLELSETAKILKLLGSSEKEIRGMLSFDFSLLFLINQINEESSAFKGKEELLKTPPKWFQLLTINRAFIDKAFIPSRVLWEKLKDAKKEKRRELCKPLKELKYLKEQVLTNSEEVLSKAKSEIERQEKYISQAREFFNEWELLITKTKTGKYG